MQRFASGTQKLPAFIHLISVNQIHHTPGDSAQNEAETTNAAIGDVLVDESAMRWEYSKPFDGLTIEEIDALSASE